MCGLLIAWLASEVAQAYFIFRENRVLFDHDPSITLIPLIKLGAVLLVSLPLCMVLVEYSRARSSAIQLGVTCACWIGLLIESYLVFGMKKWIEIFRQLGRGLARADSS
jgi:hypothetical protein